MHVYFARLSTFSKFMTRVESLGMYIILVL